MKKITSVLLIILGSLLSFVGCSSSNKYDWLATECAPENSPMQIIGGEFLCPDGYELRIPRGKIISRGWGNLVSRHIIGPKLKPLPNKVNIAWFSYREDKFYSGSFELPYEEIKERFKKGYLDELGEVQPYNKIMVGVAPGGYVNVWLVGIRDIKRVASYQADEADFPWKLVLDNPAIKREDFIKSTLEKRIDPPPTSKGIMFELWKNYEQEYKWQPEYKFPGKIKQVSLYFSNGEQTYLDYTIDHPFNTEKLNRTSYPIPKRIKYSWETDTGFADAREIILSEEEVYTAFRKFGTESEGIKLSIQLSTPKKYSKVYLINGNETIELKELEEKRFKLKQKSPE